MSDLFARAFVALWLLVCVPAGAVELQCETRDKDLEARLTARALPTADFYSTRGSRWGYQISPDGEHLLWLAIRDGIAVPHVRARTGGAVTVIAVRRPVSWAYWTADSRHIVLWSDVDGDENYQPSLVDVTRSELVVRPLEGTPGVRVFHQQQLTQGTNELLIRHNRRDAGVTDLYRVRVDSEHESLLAENPGTVDLWVTDAQGQLILRRHRDPDYGWRLERWHTGRWQLLTAGGSDERVEPQGHPPAGADWLWALSNRGRDRLALVRLSLETGAETLVYEHPGVDITDVWLDPHRQRILAVTTWPDYQHIKFFDAKVEASVKVLPVAEPAAVDLSSFSFDMRFLVLTTTQERLGERQFLVDTHTGVARELGQSPLREVRSHLTAMRPVRFSTRDGLVIHGYLSLPGTQDDGPLPTVINVHGGPFSRDFWGYQALDQLLANRGYAVLRVNFRGSTGYGRRFVSAARREFAGKMHDDLVDAASWLVKQGISDPDRIALHGRSYGGYATLVGLTMTPEVFAAGVDVMGPAELSGLIESGPAYWQLYRPRWYEFIGDPDDPLDRSDMDQRSPINFVHQIRSPLLIAHGSNDVRVGLDHSERMVQQIRRQGGEVEYLVLEGEGHRLRARSSQIRLTLAIEAFLGKHLGGRICRPHESPSQTRAKD